MSHGTLVDAEYSNHGVRFQYPHHWEIEETQEGNDLTIQVQSPETTFWCVTVMYDCPSPSHAIQTVVDAFQETYENTDVYDIENQLEEGLFLMVKQIDFVCHDLVNIARVEAMQTNEATVLILAQGFDQEMQDYESTLKTMSGSVKIQ